MKGLFILLICTLSSQAISAQSGWNTPGGSAYVKLNQWWITTDEHYTDEGRLDPNLTTGLYTTSLYANIGLSDKWAGIAYLPFFSRSLHNNLLSGTTRDVIIPGEAINNIGDPQIGIQYQVWRGKHIALSTGLYLGIPLGETGGGDLGILQTGDGEFNQILRTDAGVSFTLGSLTGYGNVYLGYNNRSEGFSDEIRYGTELGMNVIANRVLALVRLYGIASLRNGDGNIISDGSSFFANNSEHLTISPEVNILITDRLGVSAGLASVLDGRIIFAGTSYSLGIYYQIP